MAGNSNDDSASASRGLVDVVVVEGCIVGGLSGDSEVNIDVSYRLENDVDVDSSETDSLEEDLENLSDDGDEEMQEIWGKARELGAKVKKKTVTISDVTPELNFEDFPSKIGRGKGDDRTPKHVDADLEGCLSGSETEYMDPSDLGSYKSDSDAKVVCRKSKRALYASAPAPTFHLGMIFDGPVQFRDALAAYAISKGFDIKYKRNESSRIRARCKAEGCPFEIFAGVDNRDGFFKIKTFVNDHSCSITFRNTRASYKFVGKHFLHTLRLLPKLKLREMQRIAKEELNLDLNMYVCGRARKWVVEQIQARIKFEFSRLFDYVSALRNADPSANIELMVERSATFHIPKFRRIYVCFSAMKEGFKKFCRPIISLDGCYLKGSFKGEILSAVGRDGNEQLYPIAWAVVEVENKETWAWFIENLQADLGLGDGEGFTIISDMEKGLLEKVPHLLPRVEHRFCARHLYANWRKDHFGGELKKAFWACCKATTKSEFQRHVEWIDRIKHEAQVSLMKKDPKHWSRAYFDTSCHSDVVDNFSESFNAAILPARSMSIISLLEEVRVYVMRRIVKNMQKSEKWEHVFCPQIAMKLEHNKELSAYCHVRWNGSERFEVLCENAVHVVDLNNWQCSCRAWDLTGIPCPHAIAVILWKRDEISNYVFDSYRKEVYRNLYKCQLPLLPSEKFWTRTNMGSIDPPYPRKMPGSPKRCRVKEQDESRCGTRLSRKGIKHTCQKCFQRGHNSRSCTNTKTSHSAPVPTTPTTLAAPTSSKPALIFTAKSGQVGRSKIL